MIKQKNKENFSIPCQWDFDSLKRIIQLKKSHRINIAEIYGAIDLDGIENGRIKNNRKNINRETAIMIRQYIEGNDISFAYLLNSPYNETRNKIFWENVEWIINEMRIDTITCSSLELMILLKERYPNLNFNISTISGIKTIEDIKPYEEISPSKIVMHHDANRSFDYLDQLVGYCREKSIIIELMVTESCLRRCSMREKHYNDIGFHLNDHQYHMWCNNLKFSNPYEILLSNFIRPEDVGFYSTLGIDWFKITGRSKPTYWLERVIKAYSDKKYNGNLLDILGIDPNLDVDDFVHIDNSALDGFIEGFPTTGDIEHEIQYCHDKIHELYENRKLYVSAKYGFIKQNGKNISVEKLNNVYSN